MALSSSFGMHTQHLKSNTLVLLDGDTEVGRLIRLGWLSHRTRLERPGCSPWDIEPGGRWYQTRFLLRDGQAEVGVIAKQFGQCKITLGQDPPWRLVMDGWWAQRYKLLDQDDQCRLRLKARPHWSRWSDRFDLEVLPGGAFPEPAWCLLALFCAAMLHESTQHAMV
jgi:hypothetical protein